MIKKIVQVFNVLEPKQKFVLLLLQIFILLISILEIISVLSIGPYISILSNFNDFNNNKYIIFIYNFFSFNSEKNFILAYSFFIIIVFTLSTILTVIFTWFSIYYSNKITADISNQLFDNYLHKEYLFHTYNSPSVLTSKIVNDVKIVSGGVMQSIILLNSKLIISLLLILSILIYNPIITILTSSIFIFIYYLFMVIIRTRVNNYGVLITKTNSKKISNLNDSFGGIKEIIIYNLQNYFVETFKGLNLKIIKGETFLTAASYLPKFIIELIGVILIIVITVITVLFYEVDFKLYFSTLAIYALAGFKLLPNFQSIYNNYTRFLGSYPSFERVVNDFDLSNNKSLNLNKNQSIIFENLSLIDISFNFPKKNTEIIKNLSLNIERNKSYGIIGSTGSGKTTLINLIMGLYKVTKGKVKINDNYADYNKIISLRENISYVSQNIFLTNNTILENVCFGEEVSKIDLDKAFNALKKANLYDFIMKLPENVYTQVGERGIQLSGGQKQRIAIARAIYFDKDIFILDEATSSIDIETEKKIMNQIYNLKNKTIIIIAHRLSTIKNCDNIIILEKGFIKQKGSFSELLKNNKYLLDLNNS